jgi:60 kDa SS-A/Ro ribonucleoprotein
VVDSYAQISTKVTPQSQPSSKATIPNKAGGYTFQVSDETRLNRFLTLGSEGGTYYSSAKELTAENADMVFNFARSGFGNKGKYLVDQIVEISTAGRAPKQNAAIFALAIAASEGDEETRRYALSFLSQVCRTGTTLFMFLKYSQNFRGWGRAFKSAVAKWYEDKPTDKLAYQMLKYRSREGWTQGDVLRQAHPVVDETKGELFNYILGKEATLEDESLTLVWDFFELTNGANPVEVINRGHGISWEMLPDEAVTKPEVWEALLHQGIPVGALFRQLPRLTRLGLTTGETGKLITRQMTNPELLGKGRIHPVNVLIASKTYARGSGMGSSTWTPTGKVLDAFDDAFYIAYGAVEPAGKRTLLALDCSGSMANSAGGTPISCFEAEVSLSLVVQNTEPDWEIVGFSSSGWGGRARGNTGIQRLPITPRQRLDDAVRNASQFNWGGTDCALPMLWAKQEKLLFDTIIVLTDNDTWAGNIHPHQALKQYRDASGLNTRFIVCAFTGTRNTIADPDDPRELDVSGFDSAVPNLISSFSRGDL